VEPKFSSEISSVGKVLQKFFCFTPILLLIFLTNYFVDPAFLYHGDGYAQRVARILTSGHNVGWVDCDERLVQKYYINDLKASPDVLILGSSRSMQIGEDVFHGLKTVNSSVSEDLLADDLGILQIYDEKGILPKVLILEASPWMLNAQFSRKKYQSIYPDIWVMSQKLGVRDGWISKPVSPQYINMFSLSYFQSAVSLALEQRHDHKDKFFVTDETAGDYRIKLHDGSLSWPTQMLVAKTDEQIGRAATQMLSENRKDYEFHLDNARMDIMDKLIGYLQKKGVDVVIFLPPYPEETYKQFLLNPKMRSVFDAEVYFRSLAHKYHLKVAGSYNPLMYGFKDADFLDGIHARKEALGRLFKEENVIK